MNDPSTVRELTRLQNLQVKVGQQLLKGRLPDTLREDLEKLYDALDQNANKLDQMLQQGQTLENIIEPDLRHDMRNLIGIVRGYAELVKETEQIPTASLNNLLDKIIIWANRSLALLEKSKRSLTLTLDQGGKPSKVEEPKYSGTVLILDDQAANRDLLDRHVRQFGLTTIVCENAETAFDALKTQDVDLILLDLVMPDVSGHDVLARLKASPTWRAIPVIVISGLGEQSEVIRCIEAGAEDYLQKPFNRTLLQARLRSGLERKKWVDTERRLREEIEKSHRFIKNTFGRYLSSEIVSKLLDKPDGLDMGGQLQQVTILMADIRGFTTISEHLAPQKVVKLLNNYLGTMAEIIMQHNGTVDEFIGDAILALFGAPHTGENDAANAIRCAIAMQQEMSKVNQRSASLSLPEIRMGIGINSGEVVAGNIGSEKRAKYGVVGHAVNVTSRVEDQTKPDEILASASTIDSASLTLNIGRRIELQPKGVSETIQVFQIIDICG